MAMSLISSKTLTTSGSNLANVKEKHREQKLKVQRATQPYWDVPSSPHLIGIMP